MVVGTESEGFGVFSCAALAISCYLFISGGISNLRAFSTVVFQTIQKARASVISSYSIQGGSVSISMVLKLDLLLKRRFRELTLR